MTLARYLLILLLLLVTAGAGGCTSLSNRTVPNTQDAVFVVHGVDGSGPWYNDLVEGLRDGGVTSHVEIVEWGGPLLILPNLQLPAVHKDAEDKLTKRITLWHNAHPTGRISLIGHSAGCGVILGTLTSLPADFQVDEVLLLAPAVSRTYNLAPALSHVRGTMYAFCSDKDQALLNLGTSVAGTYDGVWGKSAGLTGFTTVTTLPANLQSHFRQIPYNPEFDKFGHNGDHFGYRKRQFAKQYLAPLVLHTEPPSVAQRPSAAVPAPVPGCRAGGLQNPGSSTRVPALGSPSHSCVFSAHRSSGGSLTLQTFPRPDTLSTLAQQGPQPCVTST